MQVNFNILPTELLVAVLEELLFPDLLICKQVCRHWCKLIEECVSLQYNMLLALVGMEDNPLSTISKAEKLPLLRRYQEAWGNFRPDDNNCTRSLVRVFDGPAWELACGVLAQSVGPKCIEFRQLPSSVRGIPEEIWRVDLDFDLQDFTFDASQDLLVIVQAESAKQCRVHFLTMSDGKAHPKATARDIKIGCPDSALITHEVRINRRLVGILSKKAERWCHVLVLDWLSGTDVYVSSRPFLSFCFVGDRHILLADLSSYEHPRPALVFVDLNATWRCCSFHLPRHLPNETMIRSMQLLCEREQAQGTTVGVSVPFHTFRAERLVVLMLGISDIDPGNTVGEEFTVSFSMLSSRLLSHLRQAEAAAQTNVQWSEWGPQSCRLHYDFYWESLWPCCVSGTKLILRAGEFVAIRDFNPYPIHQMLSTQDAGLTLDDVNSRYIVSPSRLPEDPFSEDIASTLPYREFIVGSDLSNIDGVMLSEDSVVIVKELSDEVHMIVSI